MWNKLLTCIIKKILLLKYGKKKIKQKKIYQNATITSQIQFLYQISNLNRIFELLLSVKYIFNNYHDSRSHKKV